MTQVLWDVDPRDWARPGANAIVNNILQHAHRRNIILMHDGGGERGQTVAALDKALPHPEGPGLHLPRHGLLIPFNGAGRPSRSETVGGVCHCL